MENELKPLKEKLQSDRHSTEKYDAKVEEWKVGYFCIHRRISCVISIKKLPFKHEHRNFVLVHA